MNTCINCNHCKSEHCQNDKIEASVKSGTGFDHSYKNWTLGFVRLAICKGDWFEPKLPDPGEGWRLLDVGKDLFQVDDEFTPDDGVTWQRRPNVDLGCPIGKHHYPHRRRLLPEIAKCPDGHGNGSLVEIEPGHFVVVCSHVKCRWCGGMRPTKAEAIAAWNNAFARNHE